MIKAKIIILVVQIIMWATIIGVGIWYLHSSLSLTGDAIAVPYASLPRFLTSIGACENGVCNIAAASGCFLCPYVQKLFLVIGNATALLWNAVIGHTWILLVFGLALFMFWKAYETIMEANKQNVELNTGKKTLEFAKWFEAVKGQLIRVLIVGAMLGGMGLGGRAVLQATTDTIVYPVMYVGTSLSMAAGGMGANCAMPERMDRNPMDSVADSFTCVIGSLNASILYGASSGFAMMNFAWLGMGGGLLTWIGGLAVVVLFLFVGFNVLFKVLNVVFNLVFIIIFLPLFLAAFAFDKWNLADGVSKAALGILAKTSVRVIGIAIEVMILTSMVGYAMKELQSDPATEIAIFEKCEQIAAKEDGTIERTTYLACFEAEKNAHPGAFEHLKNGWDFLIMMLFIFAVYYILIDKKLRERIEMYSDKGLYFQFGSNLKTLGKTAWGLPVKIAKKIPFGKAPIKK